ncbi:helix-turn-helix transcriptional regulator [Pseudomonas aeruginosa]|uniref:helix-turn-helix transcriptional regulator n=1 Tax=Pseudomonas aeruginosa TaxID=287 RepID=UPI000FF22266|nr:AlpA family phage regulatory protein [Pseudomonas aeruginosa]RWX91336.1 AlpA family phage regulatory protein [Pseudomonas aeruginosa]
MTEKNNRAALRPAQAATYLGCSTATLWRWTKTLEHFPQPHRLPGQRVTVWFQDELDLWQATHGTNRATRQNLLALAWHCVDAGLNAADQPNEGPHPFITAFLQSGGGLLEMLAVESGLPTDRVRQLAEKSDDITDDELTALFVQAAAQVIRRQRQLAQQLSEAPKLKDRDDFRRAVLDLDEAHRLCFGRTLMDYLLQEDSDHGTA